MSITILWGSSFAIVKTTLTLCPPFYFLALRFGLATIVTALLFSGHLRQWDRATIKAGVILGLLLIAGFALQTLGLTTIPATRSAFLTGLVVIFVPFIAYFRLKEKISFATGVGVLLVLVGVYLLNRPQGWTVQMGDLATVVCAFFFAWQVIYISLYTPRFSIPCLVFVQFAISTLVAILLALVFEFPPVSFPLRLWQSIALMGIFATVVAFYLQNRYQKDTSAIRAAVIYNLEQVFAALFAFFLLDEVLKLPEYIGGVFIISGVLVSELGKRNRQTRYPADGSKLTAPEGRKKE